MKPYLIPLMLLLISLIFSACGNQNAAPSATETPSATLTISVEQITAAATYRRTLPPSFTPTFTPTVTDTPSNTPTPTITLTPTTVPEATLCAEFAIEIVPPVTPIGILMLVELKSKAAFIHTRVTYIETGENIVDGDISGGNTVQIQFNAHDMPYDGDYRWEMSLSDDTRTGMCPQTGTFSIKKPEATPELTAEATVEATVETIAIPAVEFTPDLSAEATVETSPELTAEATSELTAEVTAEGN